MITSIDRATASGCLGLLSRGYDRFSNSVWFVVLVEPVTVELDLITRRHHQHHRQHHRRHHRQRQRHLLKFQKHIHFHV